MTIAPDDELERARGVERGAREQQMQIQKQAAEAGRPQAEQSEAEERRSDVGEASKDSCEPGGDGATR